MKKMLGVTLAGLFVLSATEVHAETYTVKPGDTLWGVSSQKNVSVTKLKELNKLTSNTIYVGQVLKLDTTTTSTTAPSTQATYKVVGGDSLYGIAAKYKLTVTELKSLNNLTSNVIYSGQVLKVSKVTTTTPTPTTPTTPTAGTYTVVAGDYLYKIAAKYGMTVDALKSLNGLTTNVVNVGQVLKVSGSGSTTPAPVQTQVATVKADVLNVRSGPGTNYTMVGSLRYGATATVVSTSGDWVKIQFNGGTGYVHKDYVTVGTSTTTPTPTTPSNPNGKIIMIDPGHGGQDPGAKAVDGTYEKTYNWTYSLAIKSALESRGYKVLLTRAETTGCLSYWDLTADLQCRVDKAKNQGANLFISVHHNWIGSSSARGIETYYNARSDWDGNMNAYPAQSEKLAKILHTKIVASIGGPDRNYQNKSYYVNRMAKMPSVLLELGFLSNWTDLNRIKSSSNQTKVAQAVANSVDQYFAQ